MLPSPMATWLLLQWPGTILGLFFIKAAVSLSLSPLSTESEVARMLLLWVTEEDWFSVLFKGDGQLPIKSIWGIFRLLTGLSLLISETVPFLSSHTGFSFA